MEWRKSSRSNSEGNCVEFRQVDETVQMRDSKDKTGPILIFTEGEWAAFIDGAQRGEFTL